MSEKKTHLHVKPSNPKACIRDPRSRLKLGPAGGRVPNNPFWRARLRDEDIVELSDEDIATAKQANEAIENAVEASKDSEQPDSDQKNPKPAGKAKKGQ